MFYYPNEAIDTRSISREAAPLFAMPGDLPTHSTAPSQETAVDSTAEELRLLQSEISNLVKAFQEKSIPSPEFKEFKMDKPEGTYSLSQEDMNNASNILADIAEFELGGVCLYAYMTEQVCGIKGETIRCLFSSARDESMEHYSKATTYLMRWRGGRNFINPQPSQSPGLATIKQDSSPDNSEMFLSAAVVHEQHAIEFYKKLYYAVRGKDCALENWAIEMIQIETEDLVEFQKPLGLV